MLGLLLALLVACVVVLIVATAAVELTHRAWRRTPWLAGAYGLLGVGLASQIAWVLAWVDRSALSVFTWVTLLAASIVLVRARSWRRLGEAAPVVLLTGGLLLIAVGHTFLWGGTLTPFETVQRRYIGLMVDNELPYLFAHDLWHGLPTHNLVGDWNGSDRPPLQSGLLLLIRPLGVLFGLDTASPVTSVQAQHWALAAGIVAQSLWVPAAYSLLRALGFARRAVVMAIVLVHVTPLVVWNATFTWPKLMAAAFGLASLAIFVTLRRSRRSGDHHGRTWAVAVAVALAVLGYLSHGSLAFAAPIFGVVAILALRGAGTRTWLRAGAASVASAAVLYAPWWAYTRWADPAYGRLLKWFFAGVVPVNTEPFLVVLRRAYAETPMDDLVGARLESLRRIFDLDLSARVGLGDGWITASRQADFFSPWWTLGVTFPLLVAFALLAVVPASRMRMRRLAPTFGLSAGLLVLSLVTLLLWVLAIFLPDLASVNAGSYLWLLLFAMIPSVWLAQRSIPLAAALILVQVVYDGVVYLHPLGGGGDHLSAWAIAVLVVGVPAVVLAVSLSAPREVTAPAAGRPSVEPQAGASV